MKQPEDMNADELLSAFEHLDGYFLDCNASGQGISTKDTARFKLVCDRLAGLNRGDESFSRYFQASPRQYAMIHAASIAAIKRGRSQLAKAG